MTTKKPTFDLSVLTLEELLRLNSVFVAEIKSRQASAAKVAKQTFGIGDVVKFQSSKLNRVISGPVTKIATKFITVDCGAAGIWKVHGYKLSFA